VIDIGSHECRAICIAHGRPLLATFVASPIGVKHAADRFRRSLIKSLQASGDDGSEKIVLDPLLTAELFEKTAVAVAEGPEIQATDVTTSVQNVNKVGNNDAPSGEPFTVPGWLRSDCLISLIEGDKHDEGTAFQ
jgi:hypothetical protein